MTSPKTKGLERKTLKRRYLKCFKVRTTNMATWQKVVRGLVNQGVSRDVLINWGVDDGCSRTTVSSMLSRILCALGLRERAKGAGRKFSNDALALLDYARSRYGERSLKVLRSALRAGKAEASGDLPRDHDTGSVNTTNALSKRRRIEVYCETAIRDNATPAKGNGALRPTVGESSSKMNINPKIKAADKARDVLP
jgi:hypothetical protein